MFNNLFTKLPQGFFGFVWWFVLISLTLFCLLQLKSEAASVLEVWGLCRWKRSWALFETEKRTERTGKWKAPMKRQERSSPLNFRAEFTCKFLIAAYAILILHLACMNKKCNTLIVLLRAEIACLLRAYNSYTGSCSVDELGLQAGCGGFFLCFRRVLHWACEGQWNRGEEGKELWQKPQTNKQRKPTNPPTNTYMELKLVNSSLAAKINI